MPRPSNSSPARNIEPPADLTFASGTVAIHLLRGALGLLALVGSFALIHVVGPFSLLFLPLGMLALRGCPTCWTLGLMQTLARTRWERSCADGSCTLIPADRTTRATEPTTLD